MLGGEEEGSGMHGDVNEDVGCGSASYVKQSSNAGWRAHTGTAPVSYSVGNEPTLLLIWAHRLARVQLNSSAGS